MKTIKNCKNCGKEFEARSKVTLFCCIDCRDEFYQKEKEAKLVKEGIDHVVCKWCGHKTPRIYGMHIRQFHPGKTSEDYRKEFPDAPVACANDIKATTINSGKFMKEEKYRKLFSEMWKGDKNPNSKANRSDKERKAASPFSKEFYLKKGMTDEEAESKVHEFAKNALKNRINDTNIEWYLKKGMTEEEAVAALSERQKTFSLKKCIEKYGEEEGRKRWEERQEKWLGSIFGSGKIMTAGLSYKSLEILEKLQLSFPNLKGGKHEYGLYDKKSEKTFKYDITEHDRKKIIEFNGVYWHCKPEFFNADFFHPILKITAKEKWEYDARKIAAAKEAGYDVLVIWEDDYEKDPDDTIKKCVQFLND